MLKASGIGFRVILKAGAYTLSALWNKLTRTFVQIQGRQEVYIYQTFNALISKASFFI